MVGEDGGIFAFGSADFHGSLGDRPPSRPVTSVAVLATGAFPDALDAALGSRR